MILTLCSMDKKRTKHQKWMHILLTNSSLSGTLDMKSAKSKCGNSSKLLTTFTKLQNWALIEELKFEKMAFFEKKWLLTNSSLSGTLDMKSANSLLAMAFGFSSFFVNLFVPHAMIKYLKVKMILYKNYKWSTTQINGVETMWKISSGLSHFYTSESLTICSF